MRQRKVKHLDEKMEELQYLFLERKGEDNDSYNIRSSFDDYANPLFLEIGCGKGQFITSLAKDNPTYNYVAMEMQQSVMYYAMRKAKEMELTNVKFLLMHVADGDLKTIVGESEIDGIYLNFSDPWPKAKHHKRRLTHRKKLLEYAYILKNGGFVQFKTDNEELFEFTLEEVEELSKELDGSGLQFEIVEMSRDLHKDNLDSAKHKTEYEEKFIAVNKNINFLHIKLTKPIQDLY